jgi:hypothetical protein
MANTNRMSTRLMGRFSVLMGEETGRMLEFLLSLEKKDFLSYTQVVMDIHQHKVENGNSATDSFVRRRIAESQEESDMLKMKVEEERKGKERAQGEQKEMLKEALVGSNNSIDISKILSKVEEIADKDKRVQTASKIGQSGEEWVVEALGKAFVGNGKAALTGQHGCGDIVFTINQKKIMFEVKNYQTGRAVKGTKGEVEKFFNDMQHAKSIR